MLFFIGIWDRRLLITKHIPGKTKQFDQWCTDLISLLTGSINDNTVRVGVGSFVEAYTILPESYQQARFCLRNCVDNWFASIYDFSFLADYLLENTVYTNTIHPIKTLADKIATERLCEKYDIATTVQALIANNFGLVLTSKALYIHRNTLLSRLSKLKEATGLDPVHSFAHAVICKVLFGTVVSR